MSTTVRPLGPIRRLTPILGLAIGGPAAAVYVTKFNDAILAEKNLLALIHVLLGVVIGGFMILQSDRVATDQKPMIAFGSLLLFIGLGFFWMEYSPELWRSLVIITLWCWCSRWISVNTKIATRRRVQLATQPTLESQPEPTPRGLSIMEDPELEPVS
jgi:heme A synthase